MREICEGCGDRVVELQFTEIRRGGRVDLKLCATCGLKRGLPLDRADDQLLDTEEIWASVLHKYAPGRAEEDSLACPRCGWTWANFEADGGLGCPQCYQTFMGDMTRLLKQYHAADAHQGKVPYDIGRRIDVKRRVLGVKDSIQIAIGEERFEDAARLRDEMKDLERELARLVDEGGGA